MKLLYCREACIVKVHIINLKLIYLKDNVSYELGDAHLQPHDTRSLTMSSFHHRA